MLKLVRFLSFSRLVDRLQLFARKILRPSAGYIVSDIRNVLQYIERICTGEHKNIVIVFCHAEFRNPTLCLKQILVPSTNLLFPYAIVK